MDRFIIAFLVKGKTSIIHNQLVDLVSDSFHLRKIKSPSHITLKDSIYTDSTTEIENVLLQLTQSSFPIGRVRFDGISNFRNQVYYIKASLDDNARNIYLNLFDRLKQIDWIQWDEFDIKDRKFHLTITNKANSENYISIEKLLKDYENIEEEVVFDNISILKKLETGEWIIYKSYPIV